MPPSSFIRKCPELLFFQLFEAKAKSISHYDELEMLKQIIPFTMQ